MAVALVGSFGTVASGTTSIAPAFGQSPTANNVLVLWSITYGASTNPFPSGWTECVNASGGGVSVIVSIGWKIAAGGDTAPTLTNAGATQGWAVLAEFSGLQNPPVSGIAGGAGGLNPSPLTATLGSVDDQIGNLFLSCGAWLHSKAETTTTADTYNNGATPTTNRNNDATSTTYHYRFAWGVSTGNSTAPSFIESDSSMNVDRGALGGRSLEVIPTAATYIPPRRFYRSIVAQ